MVTITDKRNKQYCNVADLDVGDFFEYAENLYIFTNEEELRAFNFSTKSEEHLLRDIRISYIENVEVILDTF